MGQLETIRFPHPIPYSMQIASPGLAEAVFSETLDPSRDPRWAESGAADPQEYAYWTLRACGVVCVKMCVEAFGKPTRSWVAWAKEGVRRGAYLIKTHNGKTEELGWLHSGLAEMLAGEGLFAQARSADLTTIAANLRAGRLVIASVSYQLGTRLPVTRKNGHLVVVSGADLEDGTAVRLEILNPSARYPDLQGRALIPAERFSQAFSGRVIVVSDRTLE
jgi:hypothetical protein